MKKLFAIVGREWRAYFLSPLAYVILTAYMFLNGFIFSRIVAFLATPGVPRERFLSLMFTNTYFWIFTLFIVPIITMRLLAEERKAGTLDACGIARAHRHSGDALFGRRPRGGDTRK